MGELLQELRVALPGVQVLFVLVFLGIVVLTALIAGLDYVLGEAVLELFAR